MTRALRLAHHLLVLVVPFTFGCAAASSSFGDDDGAGGAANDDSSVPPRPSTGAGGTSTASSSAVTSVSSTTASVASVTASSSVSSGSGMPSSCVYPADDNNSGYLSVGAMIPSWFSFDGYAANSSTAGTLTSQDLFDCDGSSGINLVVVLQGSVACEYCQEEAQGLESELQQIAGHGILVVSAINLNFDESPATIATATLWKQMFGIQSGAVVADPNVEFYNPDLDAYPITYVIDPRTMLVLEAYTGSLDPNDVLQRAAQNGG